MKPLRRVLCVAAIVFDAFLAVTALAGGIALVTRIIAPPVDQLDGALFRDYTIPGLALAVIVGGGALLAVVLLIRGNRLAALFSTAAGVVIMFFEFVEVLVIGSPTGYGLALQAGYFGLGVLIVIVSMMISLVDELTGAPARVRGGAA